MRKCQAAKFTIKRPEGWRNKANSDSTGVEHLTLNLKIVGSNPATGTRGY